MKIKNKGKVHPSPSSSSSSNDREVVLSVLKLLPAAILALASVLSLEDREVLAYLITRSLKTPSSSSSSSSSSSLESKKKSSKKAQTSSNNGSSAGSAGGHKPPMFDCDCFDCYTSYWVRWDSSPNRELIHQVIEAFEDHLTNGEKSSSKKINGRGKRRDKLGRSREAQNVVLTAAAVDGPAQPDSSLLESSSTSSSTTAATTTPAAETTSCAENAVSVPQVEKSTDGIEENEKENDAVQATEEEEEEVEDKVAEVADDDVAVALRTMAASDHKGLARKVLPDVLGLLNSRLWSLWSPNA